MIKLKDLLEEITTEMVIEIMKENGSELYKETIDNRTRQKCLWFRTICHGGNSHKLCFFTESKDFFCYTSCGRMPFFTFIKIIRNASDETFNKDVVQYLLNKIGNNRFKNNRTGLTPKLSKQVLKDFREIEETINIYDNQEKYKNISTINKFYDKNILNYFDGDIFYEGWINEGISIDSMRKYEIKWYELRNSIIIPHYNVKNELVGIRRRSFRLQDEKNKYMPLYLEGKLYDHPLALNLYGLNHNIKAIKEQKKVIFVEGEKSVLLSDTYYGKNSIAVATCGFNISEWQIKAICELVDTVYIGFDKDFDGKLVNEYKKNTNLYREYLRYEERINSLALRFNGKCIVRRIKDTRDLLDLKDSPFDKGKKTLEELLKRAKIIGV